MSCVQRKEWNSGNIFIRENRIDSGVTVPGHKHNFDHTTILFKGSVRVVTPKRTAEFKAPDYFLVKKDVEHEITALEDGTVFWCVYSHRDPQLGEVVQEANDYIEAYGISDQNTE